MRHLFSAFLFLLSVIPGASSTLARQFDPANPKEADYYRMLTIPVPEHVVLEVGGLALLPDGRLAVSTRRGEIWMIENPTLSGGGPAWFSRFAEGLHEPLGLAYHQGNLYASQRGELTEIQDIDHDNVADLYKTIYRWPMQGNYHEYAYGPRFRPDGTMVVTLNLGWIGHGASLSKWDGWMLEIKADGSMTPFATGMRSPAGFGFNTQGDLFYAENQGDWIGSGYITHVERGDFTGNPAGLRWTDEPGSPLHLKPEDIPDTGQPLFEIAEKIPALKRPAVWLPHTILGISTSDILADTTEGAFGPFKGQLFIGDQGYSNIARVSLEQVNGVYQGAAFPFREGFASGVLRMIWDQEGGMFVGMTSRGWPATGKAPWGLQRLEWTGRTPFEMKTVTATNKGFDIEFTLPVDTSAAADMANYAIKSFTYHYHSTYGSDPINIENATVSDVRISKNGRVVHLTVSNRRQNYIHEIKLSGIMSTEQVALLHNSAYYTLNEIPGSSDGSSSATSKPTSQPVNGKYSPSGTTQSPHQTSKPAAWKSEPVSTLRVGTVPGLKFDTVHLRAKRNAHVRLIFSNDDDMLHNLVITRPGKADDVASKAVDMGLSGPGKGFIPDTAEILFYTSLLDPNQKDTIYFNAPDIPGKYPFICSFPGHATTMNGILEVTE